MSSKLSKYDLAFLGAGLSSLTCLYYYLKREDAKGSIVIIERASRVGGVLTTEEKLGYHFENGAQGVLASRPNFSQLVDELGLRDRAIKPKKGLKRFLHLPDSQNLGPSKSFALSLNPIALYKAQVFSFFGLLRALCEIFVVKGANQLRDRESVYDFFSRRFGKEFAENLSIPMVTGIWAGGAKTICLKHAFPSLYQLESEGGGVFKGMILRGLKKIFKLKSQVGSSDSKGMGYGLVSFPNGMQELVLALKREIETLAVQKGISLEWVLNTTIKSVSRSQSDSADQIYSLRTTTGERHQYAYTAKALVSSFRPDIGKKIFDESLATVNEFFHQFSHLPVHSIVTCCLGGKMLQNPQEGFGILSSQRSEDWLGVLYVHSIYPLHTNNGNFLYRVLLGGDRNPSLIDADKNEIIRLAKRTLKSLELVDDSVEWDLEEVIFWRNVIVLQNPEYDELINKFTKKKNLPSDFHLVGNFLHGVSVEDCIKNSKSVSAMI